MAEDKPSAFPNREERDMARLKLGERLRGIGFDGPFDIETGTDPLSVLFGARQVYVVCLGCGAMIMLNDPLERPDVREPIERGVHLHYLFHERMLDTDHLPDDEPEQTT